MKHFNDLPDELLLRILSFVPPADLENIAFATRCLYRASHERLQEHKRLRAEYRIVELETQPEYQQLLSKVLLTDVGFYIEEVHMRSMQGGYGWEDPDFEVPDNELNLYRSVMLTSPYIDPDDIAYWIDELTSGDEDPVMAALLPLLPNLHTLTLAASSQGGEMPFLAKVVRRVALAAALGRLGTSPSFKKLRKILFTAHERQHGFDLETIARFLALPGVRTVEADCVSAFDSGLDNCKAFRRDEDLLLSNVDSCTFTYSNISLSSFRSLMAAIKGPVNIVSRIEADVDIGMRVYKISISRGMSNTSLSAQLESLELDLDDYLIDS
ncbi:hypothetical protein MMC13_001845 [Lambiella insularis]|nr:hypothetical protein [Lambiella insularis]